MRGAMQFLHILLFESAGSDWRLMAARANWLPSPLWTHTCSHKPLQLQTRTKNALSTMRRPDVEEGSRNGSLPFRRRADSHTVGGWPGGAGNPSDPGCRLIDKQAHEVRPSSVRRERRNGHYPFDWLKGNNMPLSTIVIAMVVVGVVV